MNHAIKSKSEFIINLFFLAVVFIPFFEKDKQAEKGLTKNLKRVKIIRKNGQLYFYLERIKRFIFFLLT